MPEMNIQPISETMKYNVAMITAPMVTESDLTPQNKNADASGTIFGLSAPNTVSGASLKSDSGAESGLRITWKPKTDIYDLAVEFHGTKRESGEPYSFSPIQISKFVISHNYIDNMGPEITLIFTVSGEQLFSLIDNYRDLRAHVYLRRMNDVTEKIDYTDPIIDKDYLVFLKDKEFRKRIPKKAVVPDARRDFNNSHQNQYYTGVEVQLVEDKFVNLHKKRFHFMATNCTVKSAIIFALNQCGITKVSFVPPDNTTVYTNMIIPPQQSFKSFMLYLQDTYGIYVDGLNFYMEDDIVYIYPAYRVNVLNNCPETTHFYCTGSDSYLGLKFYHAKDQNNMFHIVINNTPVIKDLMDSGAINIGTSLIVQDSTRVIDMATIIGEVPSGKTNVDLAAISVNPLNTSIFQWEQSDNADYGNVKRPYMTRFVSTSNSFKYKSELMSYRYSIIGFQWTASEPDVLRPGYAVKWHIDGEDLRKGETGSTYRNSSEYKTYDGIATSVTYTLVPGATPRATRYPFTCRADVVLLLDYLPATDHDDTIMVTSLGPEQVTPDNRTSLENDVIRSLDSVVPTAMEQVADTPSIVSVDTVVDNAASMIKTQWSDGTATYSKPVITDDDVVDTAQQIAPNLFDLI